MASVQIERCGVRFSPCNRPKCDGTSSSSPIAYVTRAPVLMQLKARSRPGRGQGPAPGKVYDLLEGRFLREGATPGSNRLSSGDAALYGGQPLRPHKYS